MVWIEFVYCERRLGGEILCVDLDSVGVEILTNNRKPKRRPV
jgi:hypothetical protein